MSAQPIGLEQLVERLADDAWCGELVVKFEGGCVRSARQTDLPPGRVVAGFQPAGSAEAVRRVRQMRDPEFYGEARLVFPGDGLVDLTVTRSVRVR